MPTVRPLLSRFERRTDDATLRGRKYSDRNPGGNVDFDPPRGGTGGHRPSTRSPSSQSPRTTSKKQLAQLATLIRAYPDIPYSIPPYSILPYLIVPYPTMASPVVTYSIFLPSANGAIVHAIKQTFHHWVFALAATGS